MENKPAVKYLDKILDQKVLWRNHIEHTLKKTALIGKTLLSWFEVFISCEGRYTTILVGTISLKILII